MRIQTISFGYKKLPVCKRISRLDANFTLGLRKIRGNQRRTLYEIQRLRSGRKHHDKIRPFVGLPKETRDDLWGNSRLSQLKSDKTVIFNQLEPVKRSYSRLTMK